MWRQQWCWCCWHTEVFFISFMLQAFISLQANETECPSTCSCENDEDQVMIVQCTDVIKRLPQNIPYSVNILRVTCRSRRDNQGKVLVELDALTSLEIGQLQRFENLTEIEFYGCPLTKLHSTTFSHLKHLKMITLTSTLLASFPKTVFEGSNSLTDLLLYDAVEFQSDGHSPFENLPMLRKIVLHNTRLNGDQLTKMIQPLKKSLKILHWQHNKRDVTLPIQTFDGFQLKELDLTNNRLIDFYFLNYTTATKIILKNNVQQSPMILTNFKRLAKLRYLDLSFTSQSSIPHNLGKTFPNLRTLIFRENDVRSITLKSLAGLKFLTNLDLGDNRIQTLQSSLAVLFNRVLIEKNGRGNVRLQNNPLHCNCELAWMLQNSTWTNNRAAQRFLHDLQCRSSATDSSSDEEENYHNNVRNLYLSKVQPQQLRCVAPSKPSIIWRHVSFQTVFSNISQTWIDAPIAYLSEGEIIRLRCASRGDPAPLLAWHMPHNSKLGQIEDTNERSVFRSSFEIEVPYSHLREVKKGEYKCEAKSLPLNVSVFNSVILINSKYNENKSTSKPPANGKSIFLGASNSVSNKYCLDFISLFFIFLISVEFLNALLLY